MNSLDEQITPTRMLFMGEAALTDGFKLIGFKTWADPTPAVLDQQLEQLLKRREKAFIILGPALAQCQSALLKQVRTEGGYIIVTQIPSLAEPDNFHCEIDDRLQLLLGAELSLSQE
ncbi:V-type ATP synthase subunit F [Sedimenticola sp.]|uniref:V-type ATP synthase subunit F n=1 Tax=Sedimenticola sp. TaxID=1940285 RepID=UPI003D0BD6DC